MENILNLLQNKDILFLVIAALLCTISIVILIFNNHKCSDYNRKNIKSELDLMKKKDDNKTVNTIENVLDEMAKNIDKKEDSITTFEDMQEEKAIISYSELINSVKNNDVIKVELDKDKNDDYIEELSFDENEIFDEPINQSNDQIIDKIDETIDILESKEAINLEPPKFKNSEFISPVYGRLDSTINYRPTAVPEKKVDTRSLYLNDDVEITPNLGPIKKNYINNIEIKKQENINDELKKNEAFLESLKEFRKNLE